MTAISGELTALVDFLFLSNLDDLRPWLIFDGGGKRVLKLELGQQRWGAGELWVSEKGSGGGYEFGLTIWNIVLGYFIAFFCLYCQIFNSLAPKAASLVACVQIKGSRSKYLIQRRRNLLIKYRIIWVVHRV